MSMMLNLINGLCARGRRFLALGRDRDAWRVLHTLSKMGGLPAEVAEEIQLLLATIQLSHDNHVRARRHLASALLIRPDNPHTHHLMATACVGGDRPLQKRAARHYRLALELDPRQPDCLCEYGSFLIARGRRAAGVQMLRQAANLAETDAGIIGKVTKALEAAGRLLEAGRLLRTLLFRNSRDPRFHQLWLDYQFRRLHEAQQHSRRFVPDETVEPETEVLPFIRPEPSTPFSAGARHPARRRCGPRPAAPPLPTHEA